MEGVARVAPEAGRATRGGRRRPLVALAPACTLTGVAHDEERIVRVREPSAWDRYRWHVVVAAGLIVAQGALIAGLLGQRARRRKAQRLLAERLRFETLLSELSATFVNLPVVDVDRRIEWALDRILTELGLDRATLAEVAVDRGKGVITHAVTAPGVEPVPATFTAEQFPWTAARLAGGEIVSFSRLDELPAEAWKDREAYRALGAHAVIVIPLTAGGLVVAALAFTVVRAERQWAEEIVQRLRLLGEILANALMRRHVETALRESEARFRLVADAAPVMIWMSGPDGGVTYVNTQWAAFTGRRREDTLGRGWVDDVHPDDGARCLGEYLRAVQARQPCTLEYRLRRSDGRYRAVLDHGVPRLGPDGTYLGHIGSAVDVSDLKAAQQALVESVELRSAVFGSLYGHVAAIDRLGVVIAVNTAWTRFAAENTGHPARVSVGASYVDACRRAAEAGCPDAAIALEIIGAALEGRIPRRSLEYACSGPHGERWFEMTAEPFRRPEGGAVISHVDVTRRRQAEEEARRQRDQLTHALRVTTLGELSAALAHEIAQPLTAILVNAEALQVALRKGRCDRSRIDHVLADVAADASRATEVIQRMRAMFRKHAVNRTPVDLDEAILDVLRLVRHDLELHGIAVTLALAPDLPPVAGDEVQLRQVVLNLVLNARDALAGVPDPRTVTITTGWREPGTVTLTVRDNGPGVAASDLERIFEPFMSTKADGLGLGLSISRSIVRSHGGKIWASIDTDRGLTIHVEVPSEGGPA